MMGIIKPASTVMTRPLGQLAAGLTAALLVLAGCTPTQPVEPTPVETIPSPLTPADMDHDQLLDLAISQYQALFDLLSDIEFKGGAPMLPESVSAYVMDPAWSAINKTYSSMYYSGNRYVSTPESFVDRIAAWQIDDPPEGTLIAVHACEVTQGAAMFTPSGQVLQDGSPVLMHRRGYFKVDARDGHLKVFVLNGEREETCPIE